MLDGGRDLLIIGVKKRHIREDGAFIEISPVNVAEN